MAAVRIETVAGTNLFRVAADALGDAREWAQIARLSGLDDPMIAAPTEIKIPARNSAAATGGILRP